MGFEWATPFLELNKGVSMCNVIQQLIAGCEQNVYKIQQVFVNGEVSTCCSQQQQVETSPFTKTRLSINCFVWFGSDRYRYSSRNDPYLVLAETYLVSGICLVLRSTKVTDNLECIFLPTNCYQVVFTFLACSTFGDLIIG